MIMQTLLLILIAVLLVSAIACLGYLIYLGRGINHVLLNLGYDIFDLARRLRAVPWEKESENAQHESNKNANTL